MHKVVKAELFKLKRNKAYWYLSGFRSYDG